MKKEEMLEQTVLRKRKETTEVETSEEVAKIQRKKELHVSAQRDERDEQKEEVTRKIAEETTITIASDFLKKEQTSGLEVNLVINEISSCHFTVIHEVYKVGVETEIKTQETVRKEEMLEQIVFLKREETKEAETSGQVLTVQPSEDLHVTAQRIERDKQKNEAAEKIAEEKATATTLDFVMQEQISGLEVDFDINQFDSCHINVLHQTHKVGVKTEIKTQETVKKEEILEQLVLQKQEEKKDVETSEEVATIQSKKELHVSADRAERSEQKKVVTDKIPEEKTTTTALDFVKQEQILVLKST
ncbi:hypothetical protein KIN20_002992 [Parelaphostrongylus tenuis]|uniref:Uncharacterized protein n=1 Tax=Parelaphostrongylus tenuis TaxID=148309 RepID=A0AAD5MHM4_PARTN|nr:hypothetical protein KIN20_002992 [Parelaphostrongylus tenuis]